MRNYALPVYLLLLLAVNSGRSEETTESPELFGSENISTIAPEIATISFTETVPDTAAQDAVTLIETSPEPEVLVDDDSPSLSQTTDAPAVVPTDSGPSSDQMTATPEVPVTPDQSSPLSNEMTATPEVQNQINSTEAPPTPVPETTAKEEPTPEAAAATRLGYITHLLELLLSALILSLVL